MINIVRTADLAPETVNDSDFTCTFHIRGRISKEEGEVAVFEYSLPGNTKLRIVGTARYMETTGTTVSYNHRLVIEKISDQSAVGLHPVLQEITSNDSPYGLSDGEIIRVLNG